MPDRNLEADIRELRARIAQLVEDATTNERLLKRNQERELELLKTQNLPELFHAICNGLRKSYGLDAITLLLSDPQHEIRHLLTADNTSLDEFPCVIFADDVSCMAPQLMAFYKPWLGPYMGCDHQLLFPRLQGLKSIALIPLWRQDIGRAHV
jgi:two-component system cell cycle response regulator